MADFDERFTSLFDIAYRVAFRVVGDRGHAEDAAVEALARCYQRWGSVYEYAEPWVARVAGNLAIDAVRHRRVLCDHKAVVTGEDMTVLNRVELVRTLRQLPARQREVVLLRYFADLSEREGGEALGITSGSVKQHAARGLAALRRELNNSDAFAG